MNYLERLIRRALLEAPARAGDVLRDPFENAAPMAFDTPAQPPAAPWPQRASAETSATLAPPPAPNAVASRDAPTTRRATEVETLRGAPPVSEVDAWTPRQGEPAPAAIAPGPVSVPVSASLAQADAFMRGMGAAMPEALPPPSALPTIAPDPPAPLRVPAAPEGARTDGMPTDGPRIDGARDALPVPPRSPETIQPLPPRLPTPQAAPRVRAEPAAAPAAPQTRAPTSPARERASSPRTVTEVVRETVHVVRVADPDVLRGAQQGASPPAFGAGQL